MDQVSVHIENIDFLNSGSNQPCVDILLLAFAFDFEDGCVVKTFRSNARFVAVDDWLLHVFGNDILTGIVGQTAKSEQTLAIVEDGICIFFGQKNRLGDQSGIDFDILAVLNHFSYILIGQNLTGFVENTVNFEVFSENPSD